MNKEESVVNKIIDEVSYGAKVELSDKGAMQGCHDIYDALRICLTQFVCQDSDHPFPVFSEQCAFRVHLEACFNITFNALSW